MPASDNNKKIDDEFVPRNTKNNNCNDKFTGGTKSVRYDYIAKAMTGDDDYPEEACDLFYHGNAQIDNLQVNTEINGTGGIDIDGNIITKKDIFADDITAAGTITALNIAGTAWDNLVSDVGSKKSFDIVHPTKPGYRLRYICLEGPEAEVYIRGKLVDSNVIQLPEYWKELVDLETIGVTLTPIGIYQELFVEKIEWGTRIIVKNNASGPINCSYVVYGERKDVSKNISEYLGTTPEDYPGDNAGYVINGIVYSSTK